jgi:hypothetical protein
MTNDSTAIAYRIKADEQAKRLEEFSRDPAIDSLQREIGVLRLLVEEQMNAQKISPGAVTNLIATMDKLIRTLDDRKYKAGELLAKSAVMRLANELVAIVYQAFEGVEGFEDRVDQIMQRMPAAIAMAKNDE